MRPGPERDRTLPHLSLSGPTRPLHIQSQGKDLSPQGGPGLFPAQPEGPGPSPHLGHEALAAVTCPQPFGKAIEDLDFGQWPQAGMDQESEVGATILFLLLHQLVVRSHAAEGCREIRLDHLQDLVDRIVQPFARELLVTADPVDLRREAGLLQETSAVAFAQDPAIPVFDVELEKSGRGMKRREEKRIPLVGGRPRPRDDRQGVELRSQ